MLNSTNDNTDLDKKWLELISSAKEIGISLEGIRNFLNQSLKSA
ncbi:SinR repressor domain-containing protein dimerization [Niallia nealsonii]|uniref:SinR repressor domain-containing protein dimerization n=2 Tax=Niallia nealsonii TaxID=115979 RepID=A0A2N0Z4J5_9BACI|nr:SinR repressor domain-containing protein dimerization [Niallia nealsonii]